MTKLFTPEVEPAPFGNAAPTVNLEKVLVAARPFWAKATVDEAKADGTTDGPLTKIVSLMDGGTPEPTLREVALTRTLVITNVKVPPGVRVAAGVVPLKLTVEPLMVP